MLLPFQKDAARAIRHWREFRAAAARSGCSPLAHARWFPAWSRSVRRGASSMRDEQPWIAFPAIAFLRGWLQPGMRVFEWGSGGSTLFWARHGAAVTAIENDGDWARRVQETCAERGLMRVTVEHLPHDPEPPAATFDAADPDDFFSASATAGGRRFERYATRIAAFADDAFDLIVVDGRARPACLRQAQRKVKPGGIVLLDNSERPHYARARALFDGLEWRARPTFGPAPYTYDFSHTLLWERLR